jgi:peroxiredoxin
VLGPVRLLSPLPFLQGRSIQSESTKGHAGDTAILKIGQSAPAFEIPDADMILVSLSDFPGAHNVVLDFYPKGDTRGCTMQAIDFSDFQEDFAGLDPVVIGVSRDD